jgi:hypothetical protein
MMAAFALSVACSSTQEIKSTDQGGVVARETLRLAPASVCKFDPSLGAQKYALLIGASGYAKVNSLSGPRNDIALLYSTLVSSGVAEEHICVLADRLSASAHENGVHASALPSRRNIDKAMTELASSVPEGAEVMLYLSGHGSYMPDSPREGSPIEPDGTDEFFLPLDIGTWSEGQRTVENALIDDDIEKYIARIQQAGAFVWMVADFCHSGFSSRDGAVQRNISEQERRVALGIPASTISVRIGGVSQSLPAVDTDALDMSRFVGFYAAKSNEPTFEYPVESGDDLQQFRYHGILTWNLVEAIRSGGAQSYRALATRIRAAYWEWGQSRVTPVFDGNLSALPMIGAEGDELRAVTKNRAGEYLVDFGGIDGVAEGATVTLLGLTQEGSPVVATAKLTGVGLTQSVITLDGGPDLAYLQDFQSADLDCGPKNSASEACRIIGKDPLQTSVESSRAADVEKNWYRLVGAKLAGKQYGFNLKVASLPGMDEASSAAVAELLAEVSELQEESPAGPRIQVQDSTETNKADIYLTLEEGSLFFLTEPAKQECLQPTGVSVCEDPVGAFLIDRKDATAENVLEALRRYSKARNILALAGGLSRESEKYKLGLELKIGDPVETGSTACADPGDATVEQQLNQALEESRQSATPIDPPLVVGNCNVVGLNIQNGGRYPLDITALYVKEQGQVFWLRDYPNYKRGALRILPGETKELVYTEVLNTDEGGKPLPPQRISLVVLATEADLYRDFGPDFRWLEQSQIEQVEAKRSGSGEDSAFGDLLESVAFGTPQVRSSGSRIGAVATIQYTLGEN